MWRLLWRLSFIGEQFRPAWLAFGLGQLVNLTVGLANHLYSQEVDIALAVLLLVTSLLFFLGSPSSRRWLARGYRKARLTILSIAVLDGTARGMPNEVPATPSWSEFGVDDWIVGIERDLHVRPKTIPADGIGPHFRIVVNPFGERYPEEDPSVRRTFSRIKDYVAEGGVFVNVAGFPFFWEWLTTNPGKERGTSNPVQAFLETGRVKLGKRKLAILEPITLGKPSLIDTQLSREFDLRTTIGDPADLGLYQYEGDARRFGAIAWAGGTNRVREFRSVLRGSRVLPACRADHPIWGECYPLAAIPLGLGYILLCGLDLKRNAPETGFDKVIAFVQTVAIKLAKNGSLED